MSVIEEIARQTSLLALNAAIGGRPCRHGKGGLSSPPEVGESNAQAADSHLSGVSVRPG
jgi:hypothetical protein